jgi:hypothetical protein
MENDHSLIPKGKSRPIVDCHVNIGKDKHLLPAFAEQTASARPGSVGLKADADTVPRPGGGF